MFVADCASMDANGFICIEAESCPAALTEIIQEAVLVATLVCPAIFSPAATPLRFSQKSTVKFPEPTVQSVLSGVVIQPPPPSIDAVPNFIWPVDVVPGDVTVHVCALPPAFTSGNDVPPFAPSMWSRIFVKLSFPAMQLGGNVLLIE